MSFDNQITEERAHVRKRPGMYIGGTDSRAMHHLVYSVLDHLGEEAVLGRCSEITVTLYDNNKIVISDNSLGFSTAPYLDSGLTQFEVLLERFIGKEKLAPEIYQENVLGGLHGLGLMVVNSLSETFVVENAHEGFLWTATYKQGIRQKPLERGEATTRTGTTFIIIPDFSILEHHDFELSLIEKRLQTLAYLNPNLSLTLQDFRKDKHLKKTFTASEGLKTLIADFTQFHHPLHPIIHSQQTFFIAPNERMNVEIALCFTKAKRGKIISYINTAETTLIDEGIHFAGLRAGILGFLNDYPDKGYSSSNTHFRWGKVSKGLFVAVSIRLSKPQFASPTRTLLRNPEAFGAVAGMVYTSMAMLHRPFYELLTQHFRSQKKTLK